MGRRQARRPPVVVRRVRRLRDFWQHPTGPGTVPCTAVRIAKTALGDRPVSCVLRTHEGRHYGLSGGSWPVWWTTG